MTTIDIGEAATQLPQLIERVHSGEEIRITRAGRPVAQISPIGPEPSDAASRDDATPNLQTSVPPLRRNLADQFRDDPWLTSIDLDAPLDEEVARAFGMLDE